MAIDLHALVDQVNDERSFLHFVATLAADWEEEREIEAIKPSSPYGAGALGWENGTVGAVLDAAVRWGEASIDGLRFYKKPENPWQRAAQILHAGKFYE
ncbi:MAG: hypothetical protein M3N82_17615 [Pseudomonadota bacterium]|nr:hypothetical protein [Pseudomonadota bacterium]